MIKSLKFFLVIAIVALFFTSSAYARPSFNPKGWIKGKKKGWHGESTPPGFSKKELKAQEKAAKKEAKKAEKEAKKLEKKAEETTEEEVKSTVN